MACCVPYDSVYSSVGCRHQLESNPFQQELGKVKYEADEQDVFDVANQLVSLQKFNLDEIRLNQSAQLTS